MRIELERRPNVSKLFSILSPAIALALTMIFGGIMFMLLGKNPVTALYSFFIEPLMEVWSLHELAIKAAPLILIGVGLSVCYRSNNWNIGAEGQFIAGAIAGSILPVVFYEWHSPLVLPLMLLLGMLGGALFAGIPAFLKAHLNTNEILTSLMLVYVAQLFLDWLVRGPWRNPGGMNFPETRTFDPVAVLPEMIASGRTHWGFGFAILAAIVIWFMMRYTLKGFEITVLGQSERAGRFAGFSSRKMIWFSMLLSGALRRACRHLGGQRRDPAVAAGHFARLRLHRDHRRLSRTAQSVGDRRGRSCAGADLSRRRGGATVARCLRQGDPRLPGTAALLRALLRHAHPLQDQARMVEADGNGCGRSPLMGIFEAILLTVITAATPLVLAAVGELVTERSGVLNLGVEGMMVMGAVCAFVATQMTGIALYRHSRRHRVRRLVLAAVRLPDADARCQSGGDGPGVDHPRSRRLRHDR